MHMDAKAWKRLQDVFNDALDVPGPDREAFLAGLELEPDELSRVERLLEADAREPAFLEPARAPDTGAPGERVGAYELVERIGEGGMGTVYRAVRIDGGFSSVAAVKLLRPSLGRSGIEARFRSERQILAALDHPCIARLLDGGVSAAGQPYLVMEHVADAVPVDTWCDGLELPGRLRLFREVCDAVTYAHGKLVVHRDLKPTNILVGADGRPRLLDFGIAKVLDPEALDLTLAETGTGALPLSLSCAAPEQVRGGAITTATDVYALGVLLYRLISGRPPYSVHGDFEELVQQICVDEPPPPSAHGPRGAQAVSTRDLDAIALKALRKTPAARYATVDALSDDVLRALERRPVRARQDTPAYVARTFVRRHRGAIAAAVGVLLALSGGLLAATWQARLATLERDRALVAQRSAERITDLVVALFEGADPELRPGAEALTALEVLDRGEAQVLDQLGDEPEARARLLRAVGSIRAELGDPERAVALHSEALEILSERRPDPDPDVAELLHALSDAEFAAGDLQAAEEHARAALALHTDLFGADDERTLRTQVTLGMVLTRPGADHLAEAEAGYAHIRSRAADGSLLQAEALFGLAEVHRISGRFAEAADHYRAAADLMLARDGPDSLQRAMALEGVGVSLYRSGALGPSYEEAVEEALAVKVRVLGPDHLRVADSLTNFGAMAYAQGRYELALQRYRAALDLKQRAHGEDHDETALLRSNMGMAHLLAGNLEAAETELRASHELRLALQGPDTTPTAHVAMNLARVLVASGQLDEARDLATHAAAVRRAILGAHAAVARDEAVVGWMHLARGERALAERALRASLSQYDALFEDGHLHATEPALWLAALLLEAEPGEARDLAAGAAERRARALAPGHWQTAEAHAWRRLAEAKLDPSREPAARDALRALDMAAGADHWAARAVRAAGP